jgi:hypothetical protein
MEWFVQTPDGRTLAVEDAGDPGGRPVMACAALLPDLVTAAASLCSLTPMTPKGWTGWLGSARTPSMKCS